MSENSSIAKFGKYAWPLLVTQMLSCLIAGTAISSESLVESFGINCPTFQSVGNYILLLLVYLPCYIYGGNSVGKLLKETWWNYALLSLIDFEANYTIVKAYQYTSITSVQVHDTIYGF
jgi:solute carrier family 35 protein F1/2